MYTADISLLKIITHTENLPSNNCPCERKLLLWGPSPPNAFPWKEVGKSVIKDLKIVFYLKNTTLSRKSTVILLHPF